MAGVFPGRGRTFCGVTRDAPPGGFGGGRPMVDGGGGSFFFTVASVNQACADGALEWIGRGAERAARRRASKVPCGGPRLLVSRRRFLQEARPPIPARRIPGNGRREIFSIRNH